MYRDLFRTSLKGILLMKDAPGAKILLLLGEVGSWFFVYSIVAQLF